MTKRRAIILLILIFLFMMAVLSVAAYTVQTQNDSNATTALTASMAKTFPMPVPQNPTVAPVSAPSLPNDAIDTDTSSVQYKTVAGGEMPDLYAFEAPIDWNSLHQTVGTCTTETIVSPQNATIDITPSDCASASQQGELVQKDGYDISTSTADSATFNHVLGTFHIAS